MKNKAMVGVSSLVISALALSLSSCNLGRDYTASDEPMDFQEMMNVISAKSYSHNSFYFLSGTSVDYKDIPQEVYENEMGNKLGRFIEFHDSTRDADVYYDLETGYVYDGILDLGTVRDIFTYQYFDIEDLSDLEEGNKIHLYALYSLTTPFLLEDEGDVGSEENSPAIYDANNNTLATIPDGWDFQSSVSFTPTYEGQYTDMSSDYLIVEGQLSFEGEDETQDLTIKINTYGNSVPVVYGSDDLPDMVPYDFIPAGYMGINGYLKEEGNKFEVYDKSLQYRNVLYLNSLSDSTNYYPIGDGKLLTVESLDSASNEFYGLPMGTQRFHTYDVLNGNETTKVIKGWLVGYQAYGLSQPTPSSFSLPIDFDSDGVIDGVLLPAVSYEDEGLGTSNYYIWVEPDGHIRGGFRWNGTLPSMESVSASGPLALPNGDYFYLEDGSGVVTDSQGQQIHAFDGYEINGLVGKRGFIVRKDGKYGLLDFAGEVLEPVTYDDYVSSSELQSSTDFDFTSQRGDYSGLLENEDGTGVLVTCDPNGSDLSLLSNSVISAGAIYSGDDVYSHSGLKIGVLAEGGDVIAGSQTNMNQYDFVTIDTGDSAVIKAVVIGLSLSEF